MINGERVSAGDPLTSGSPVLHDILRIMGPEMVQRYLVDQIQQIYRLQGIDINDRHIELIVRQMLRKVRVVDPGDTDFLIGDRVDRIHFKMVNSLLKQKVNELRPQNLSYGYYPGIIGYRKLYLCSIIPRNHSYFGRSGYCWKSRSLVWFERKRYCW